MWKISFWFSYPLYFRKLASFRWYVRKNLIHNNNRLRQSGEEHKMLYPNLAQSFLLKNHTPRVHSLFIFFHKFQIWYILHSLQHLSHRIHTSNHIIVHIGLPSFHDVDFGSLKTLDPWCWYWGIIFFFAPHTDIFCWTFVRFWKTESAQQCTIATANSWHHTGPIWTPLGHPLI